MAKFPIKGFNEGLLVTIGEGNWKQIVQDLLEQIDEKLTFFSEGKVGIDVGERVLRVTDLTNLRDQLFDRQVKLFAVISTSKVTEDNAASLGLITRSSIIQESESKLSTAIFDGEPAILIKKTLRSGNKVDYNGHVIVMGDVNPGAEITCVGSIIIWGKLRGTVHAGAGGSRTETICAMIFDPIKLRIANISLKSNKLVRKLKKKPVTVCLDDDKIALDYWDV